jgi:hypothetical protein
MHRLGLLPSLGMTYLPLHPLQGKRKALGQSSLMAATLQGYGPFGCGRGKSGSVDTLLSEPSSLLTVSMLSATIALFGSTRHSST